jgi:hypothetical protein
MNLNEFQKEIEWCVNRFTKDVAKMEPNFKDGDELYIDIVLSEDKFTLFLDRDNYDNTFSREHTVTPNAVTKLFIERIENK